MLNNMKEKRNMVDKKLVYVGIFFLIIGTVVASFASAGVGNWLRQITGKATNTVDINITVGVPQVIGVFNNTGMSDFSVGLNAGPANSTVYINFSVYSPSGVGNLNTSSAGINFSKSGEALRQNTTGCIANATSSDYVNFTCTVQMLWFDGSGTWDIMAYIEDNSTNYASNTSGDFQIGSTTGFSLGPTSVTFSGIAAGATNKTSDNDPIELNNTGNQAIGLTAKNISINATNLRGETDTTIALWATNFTVHWETGDGPPPLECAGTDMRQGIYTNITSANLSVGNFSLNDGGAGQERLYLCLQRAGSELTTQSYSTANESSWTIQIA
jgi:hypothetical protein